MSTRLLTLVIALALAGIWSIGLSYFYHRVDTESQNYTQRQITDLNIAWTAVQHLQRKGKDAYFQTYILKPDMLELLHQAQNPQLRDSARTQMYQHLKPVYESLKQQGVHQFQFVLPNTHSLLRMHQPELYGDDLSDLRLTFYLANQRQTPIFGFELGRVLPGFRAVYPIVDQGVHLGAVEFSNAFETLRKDIAYLDPSREYALIIHPRAKRAMFDEFKSFYTHSVFNPDWLDETSTNAQATQPLSDYAKAIGQHIASRKDVRQSMQNAENFAVSIDHNNQTHVASFLVIKDINNLPAAYLVALSPAPLLDGLKHDLVNNISVTTILIVLLGWMIFAILRHRNELRIAATAFNVQEGITITDAEGKILKVNKAFTRLTGYKPQEVIGQTPAILSSGRQDRDFYRVMWQTLKKTGSWQGEIWNRRKSGELYAEWLTITAVYDDKGRVTHYVGAFLDITQRKEDEEQIRQLAFYDPLTELPNRRLLYERLEHAMATSSRTLRYCAVLFIDLDNFKTLNDTKGHELGDQLLLEVAKRLKTHTRQSDTVSRLGGDEFVVLYEGLNKQQEKAYIEIEYLAEEIRASLNQPYEFDDYQHFSSPSIGIALFCGHQISMEELLRNADSAMYQAKNAGRNTIRLFDPQMQQALEKRLALEEDLRNAIEQQQLVLFLQPQVDDQNQTIGAEALIRWQHPQHGLIAPNQFIPIAEDSGLIIKIGDWVLQQVCSLLAQWESQPQYRHLTLSANISAKQLRQADFVERVQHWLECYKINPKQLKLEITESMLLDDLEDTAHKMQQIKALGVLFSMDDFGTGYSSLSIIKSLPLDQLKIDQSFIQDLEDQESSRALTHTIIAMSQALNLSVIAEGVERESQRQILRSLNCHQYQGYLFAKPMPISEWK